MHSMWSSVNVKLNHTLVSTSGVNYMYKALIENLLNYDADAKKIQVMLVSLKNQEILLKHILTLFLIIMD